jgi:lipopolysaccharide/colanic/teichoic acid biosynthesis glycosyltransferase
MGVLKQIAEYLYIRKPDPNRPKSDFIKKMHWINRTSILIFLLCLVMLAIKLFS